MPSFTLKNVKSNKGTTSSKKNQVAPVTGFGNIQYNIPEDVALSKKVDEKDVFDKNIKKKVSKTKRTNKGTNRINKK